MSHKKPYNLSNTSYKELKNINLAMDIKSVLDNDIRKTRAKYNISNTSNEIEDMNSAATKMTTKQQSWIANFAKAFCDEYGI